MKSHVMSQLAALEAESIQVMREVVAECEKPVMLYSIGKDSAVMLHLALKAFYPAKLPFPLLHVDTKWKFRDMYAFRERMVREHGFDLPKSMHPIVGKYIYDLADRHGREPARDRESDELAQSLAAAATTHVISATMHHHALITTATMSRMIVIVHHSSGSTQCWSGTTAHHRGSILGIVDPRKEESVTTAITTSLGVALIFTSLALFVRGRLIS